MFSISSKYGNKNCKKNKRANSKENKCVTERMMCNSDLDDIAHSWGAGCFGHNPIIINAIWLATDDPSQVWSTIKNTKVL